MMSQGEQARYSPLSIDEDIEDETAFLAGGQRRKQVESRSTSDRLFLYACLGVLICSILNIALWAGAADLLTKPRRTLDVSTLERPNVYIGLEKVPKDIAKAALPESLDVFPPLFQPVDKSNPKKAFPVDQHGKLTFQGRISPGDKNVLLTSQISMVAQYRVHDYGMERCALISQIPTREQLQAINQTLELQGSDTVEVWNLTTSRELVAAELTWRNKPPRGNLLGKLTVSEGQISRTEDFHCGPSGSLQTYELVCANEDCHVDFWQSIYLKPRYGIYMSQQPSL